MPVPVAKASELLRGPNARALVPQPTTGRVTGKFIIVNRLNAEAAKALTTTSVRKVLDDAAATAGGNSPQAFAEFVRSETTRLGELIRAANITMD